MHHLNHEFFSTISSMNSFSRSSRLNPHCPGGAGLWSGGGRKSTACDPPCFLHLPSPESERFFPSWQNCSTDVKLCHTPEWGPISKVNVQRCFDFEGKCGQEKILRKTNYRRFFQTLLCFYCCYSFQTLPFFHRSSHSSLSLLLLQPCVTVSNTASPPLLPRLCSATLTLCRKV